MEQENEESVGVNESEKRGKTDKKERDRKSTGGMGFLAAIAIFHVVYGRVATSHATTSTHGVFSFRCTVPGLEYVSR